MSNLTQPSVRHSLLLSIPGEQNYSDLQLLFPSVLYPILIHRRDLYFPFLRFFRFTTHVIVLICVREPPRSRFLMRRTSVSLPTRNVAHDPHEKPARYSTTGARSSAAGTLEKLKAAWMTQSQRSRYLKTGGLLLFIVFLFYYLSPGGKDGYGDGMFNVPCCR